MINYYSHYFVVFWCSAVSGGGASAHTHAACITTADIICVLLSVISKLTVCNLWRWPFLFTWKQLTITLRVIIFLCLLSVISVSLRTFSSLSCGRTTMSTLHTYCMHLVTAAQPVFIWTDDHRRQTGCLCFTPTDCIFCAVYSRRSRYLPADVCRGQKQQRADCKVADSATVGIWEGTSCPATGARQGHLFKLTWRLYSCERVFTSSSLIKADRSVESDVICFLNKALPSVAVTSGVWGLFLPVSRCDETVTPE